MMYRISTCVCKVRCLLHQYKPIEQPVASLSRYPPNNQFKKWQDPERETCPKPKVEPPPQKDDSMFWGALSLLVITGGFAVYAKGNPEVRDWLSMHAAWFDDFIAVAYQENMSYLEFAMSCIEDIKNRLISLVDPPKECTPDEIDIIFEIPDVGREIEDGEHLTVERTPCDILPPPIVTKDICEIEACIKDLANNVIHNYMTARDACLYYNQLIRDTMNNFTITGMKKLRQEMEERRELVKTSLENVRDCVAHLDDLTQYLGCGLASDQKEKVDKTIEMLNEYKDKIKQINFEYQLENEVAIALDAQWTQLEVLMDNYMSENQSAYPMLDYEEKEPTIVGDADFLILHTRRHVNKLQEDVKNSMEIMTNKIDGGLETLSQKGKEKKERDNKIAALYKKRNAELDADFANRLYQLTAASDKATKDALKQQQKKHEEEVALKMKRREDEVMKSFDKIVAESVGAQKRLFVGQLENMKKKLSVVEGKLNARLKADRETKRSQDLWSAGASLLAATKKGDPYIPVSKELRAIERASDNDDKLVLTVLNSIPQSVWDKGVVPESVLREKYHSMEHTALKVALVEQDGAPLPVYVMSWLQSALLFMKLRSMPQIELDNPPKEPYNFKHLDTFDLLQRARYFVERGNIAAALRYVSALEGASRSAASSWYEAARAHLETKQAAEAVLAHAAAIGLQYV